MDPSRDLGAIADLIDEAFAHEIDERGRAAIREMRWMARLSPLVWWWSQTDPSFQDAFNGFVWEEPLSGRQGKQIVGNVNLNRTPGSHQRRIVCNVVVQEAHRGRGLGRRLTEAAVAEARKMGADGVVLQVYEDNPGALQLYTDLGFREVAGEIELRLNAVQPVALVAASDHNVRAWRPSDGEASYQLAQQVTPQPLNWIRPVRPRDYRMDRWTRLVGTLANWGRGRQVHRLVARAEDRLMAMMTVTSALRRGPHRMELLVHPDYRGQVEGALVSRALHLLSGATPRAVRTTVLKDHRAAVESLRAYGFEEQRTLLTLRQDFKHRG
jgi:ribosomal protein S18 acetylase RimI-like enzyme